MSKQKEYGELITEELTHLITISLADWTAVVRIAISSRAKVDFSEEDHYFTLVRFAISKN